MKADLLLQLADLLDSLPGNRFNYAQWADARWKDNGLSLAPSCGTSACALGWATTIPELGLEMRISPQSAYAFVARVGFDDGIDGPFNGYDSSIESAMVAFDVEREEAIYLFTPETTHPQLDCSPPEHADPSDVATHIRTFVEFNK